MGVTFTSKTCRVMDIIQRWDICLIKRTCNSPFYLCKDLSPDGLRILSFSKVKHDHVKMLFTTSFFIVSYKESFVTQR